MKTKKTKKTMKAVGCDDPEKKESV